MAKKKTAAKAGNNRFSEQARGNIANVLKTYKKLELDLAKVKKDMVQMMTHAHGAPVYSMGASCPKRKKRR